MITENDVAKFLIIEKSESGEELNFKFSGRLDSKACETISNHAIGILQKSKNEAAGERLKINFDLAETTFVSSMFLRVCMVASKSASKLDFKIYNPSRPIYDILKMSGFDKFAQIINVRENLEAIAPPADFVKKANISSLDEYKKKYSESIENPEEFWKKAANENIDWFKPFDKVLEWDLPHVKWFDGGKLNVSHNCADRHLDKRADKPAIIWEGELYENGAPQEKRTLTYRELHKQTCRFANVLKNIGVQKGDRVVIYLPMIPEAVIAMLACARIGAIHSIIFAGFSSQAIADRVADCQASLIITADGGYRRGKTVSLKENVDASFDVKSASGEALCKSVKKTIVIKRTCEEVVMTSGRDYWYEELAADVSEDCPAEIMDAESPLFILYTSGSTGKPKGLFHSSAGYLLHALMSFKYIFDYKPDDVYWCTADVGWVTGHSYIVYGPLASGATVYMYEGAPNYPEPDRFWRIIEQNKITVFYTAPTAIRAFMKWGEKWINNYDLSSLRLLGTVGEPINPEAWKWYFDNIGGEKCPIIDTWWQTETGGVMIAGTPGAAKMKPGSAGLPFLGVLPDVVDEAGDSVEANQIGKLIIRRPWLGMARGIWTSEKRYIETYWSDFPGSYFTGDSARKDEDGYFWIVGRVDDVIVVSGHNIGTAEIESALVANPAVAEAAAVGRPDDKKTSAIVVFVTLKTGGEPSDELIEELKQCVSKEVGKVAKPDEIRFAEALPKTRSGKIMRRLLRQMAAGAEVTGDVTTLEDFTALKKLSEGS